MLEFFLLTFRLRNTYRANTMIYSISSIPLIRQMHKNAWYSSRTFKGIAYVLSVISEIGSVFITKALYIGLLIICPMYYMKRIQPDNFLHILLFLTLIGGLLNARMIEVTKDKYYAILLMRMDAKKYTLIRYFYYLLKTLLGFFAVLLIAALYGGIDWLPCLLFPWFAAGIKCIVPAGMLYEYKTGNKNNHRRAKMAIAIIVLLLLLTGAYLPVYFGYAVPAFVFYMVCIVGIAGSVFCIKYMLGFLDYLRLWKETFVQENTAEEEEMSSEKIMMKVYQESMDINQTSQKSGYVYFNDLFFKRHNKLLTKSAKWITVIAAVCFAAAMLFCAFSPGTNEAVNELILTRMSTFVIVLYFINSGKTITQVMFMNCDHSMLTYRFYRKPEIILKLFFARLISAVRINLMPAGMIAAGLVLLLMITGGANHYIDYLFIFAAILAMSVFFSVHYLVLYYLLQPYNMDIELKSPIFKGASFLTYLICYIIMGRKIPMQLFSTGVFAFCMLYIMVALLLIYRFAPKTFRLKA